MFLIISIISIFISILFFVLIFLIFKKINRFKEAELLEKTLVKINEKIKNKQDQEMIKKIIIGFNEKDLNNFYLNLLITEVDNKDKINNLINKFKNVDVIKNNKKLAKYNK